MLSLGLGAAPAFGGAGADQIALDMAKPPSTASIKRPVLLVLSADGSAKDRNCALASTMRLTMANRSKVLRARRSIRVTAGLADVVAPFDTRPGGSPKRVPSFDAPLHTRSSSWEARGSHRPFAVHQRKRLLGLPI
jgi:hypothetical protein